jgi:hypothetical protein
LALHSCLNTSSEYRAEKSSAFVLRAVRMDLSSFFGKKKKLEKSKSVPFASDNPQSKSPKAKKAVVKKSKKVIKEEKRAHQVSQAKEEPLNAVKCTIRILVCNFLLVVFVF